MLIMPYSRFQFEKKYWLEPKKAVFNECATYIVGSVVSSGSFLFCNKYFSLHSKKLDV